MSVEETKRLVDVSRRGLVSVLGTVALGGMASCADGEADGSTLPFALELSSDQVNCVESIAELRALDPGTAPSQCYLVLGYYTANDGGGGVFYWDTGASEPDDAGMVLEPDGWSGAGRWRRLAPMSGFPCVNVKYFGAAPSATAATNDAAFAAALASANGVPIFIPPGTYDLSSTWIWHGIRGQEVFGGGSTGSGIFKSRLRWTAEGGSSIIHLLGSRDCHFRDLHITFLDSGNVAVDDVIVMETTAPLTMTNNRFTQLFIHGTASQRYNRGIVWVAGTGGNANNDLNILNKVTCINYTDCAFDITHSQSTGHHFSSCAGGGGQVLVRTVAAFDWISGTSYSGNSDADFKVVGAATTQQTFIKGFKSEGSGCLLDVKIGTSTMGISLEEVSFHSSKLREDNRMIDWQGFSFLRVVNCRLGSHPNVAGSIHLTATGNQSSLQTAFQNNCIITSLTNPFTAFAPKHEQNVTVQTASEQIYRGRRSASLRHHRLTGHGRSLRFNSLAAWHIQDFPDTASTNNSTITTVLELAVPNNTAGRFSATVVGRRNTGELLSAAITAHVENDSGTVFLSDIAPSYKDPHSLGYTVTLVGSNDRILVQVTGGATDVVKWACVPDLVTVEL